MCYTIHCTMRDAQRHWMWLTRKSFYSIKLRVSEAQNSQSIATLRKFIARENNNLHAPYCFLKWLVVAADRHPEPSHANGNFDWNQSWNCVKHLKWLWLDDSFCFCFCFVAALRLCLFTWLTIYYSVKCSMLLQRIVAKRWLCRIYRWNSSSAFTVQWTETLATDTNNALIDSSKEIWPYKKLDRTSEQLAWVAVFCVCRWRTSNRTELELESFLCLLEFLLALQIRAHHSSAATDLFFLSFVSFGTNHLFLIRLSMLLP